MKTALLLAMSALAAGCATRSLPSGFPPAAASSRHASEAPKQTVVSTLQSDPPLPGEPTAAAAASSQKGPGHHGH